MVAISELGFKPDELPAIMLPYQQRWIADTSPVKLYTKSRRIGISWAEAADCALSAASSNGENCFYVGYEKEMARTFIQDAAEWAKAYQLTASQIDQDEEVFRDGDQDKSVLVFRIHFDSGKKIEALSSAPRNLRSRQGRVIIDEAAFHDDFPGLFKAAKALLLWGSHIHLITTYNGVDEPYYELEQDVLSGKYPYSRHFTTFDDALSQGLYKRICLVTGQKWSQEAEAEWRDSIFAQFGEDANEELLCIPRQSGGAYFSRALVESCMKPDIPVLRLSYPEGYELKPIDQRESECKVWCFENLLALLEGLNQNLRTCYGMDFARVADLSVIIVFQIQQNLVRRSPFVVEMRNAPLRQQEQVLFYICDRLPRFVGGANDASGNGFAIAEAAAEKYGFGRIQQVKMSQPWYAENMPKYKAGFEDNQIELPRDADILQDHRDVEVVKGIPLVPAGKKNKGSDGQQRHGDSAIAGCLAWAASLMDAGPIEFEEIYKRQTETELVGFDADVNFRGW
jgi:phage FluMu gp28-like protein